MRKIYFLIFFSLISYRALSQEETNLSADTTQIESNSLELDTMRLKPKYGVYGAFNHNLHFASFRNLPNVPCCAPFFENGSGSGFNFGLLFEKPIDSLYRLNFRLGYTKLDGKVKSLEYETIVLNGNLAQGQISNNIDAKLSAIQLEGGVSYRVWKELNVGGGLGLLYMAQSTYDQIERIESPANQGVFEKEGTSTRNHKSGDIPDVNKINLALNISASYDLPLNKTKNLILAPEISFSYNILKVASGVSWNVAPISFGASIKYCAPPTPPPPPPPPIPAPLPPAPEPPAPPKLMAELKASQYDSVAKKDATPKIAIEDFVSTNMRPLLNFIFFDENSSELPQRYVKLTPEQTNTFSLYQLHNSELLPTYYNVLNIIGRRLTDNPKTDIKIVGCNSGVGVEKKNKALSTQRAETVRDYFANVWGISEKRMKIIVRNMPDQESNNDEPGGKEENQRVEILSNDWEIMEPAITADTLKQIKDATIKFYPKATSEAGLANWNLEVSNKGQVIKSFDGSGAPSESIDYAINSKTIPMDDKTISSLSAKLKVLDKSGQSFETKPISLPVEKLTVEKKRASNLVDKEIDYYSLILFDFGKSKLKNEHKQIIKFVKDRVASNSKVNISGFTDAMGNPEINEKIATERAKAAAKSLGVEDAEISGVGDKELLYDNNTPEGRFYCRTVKITIETPIAKQ